ncbi:bifunctional serine/threonine-protein kinase/formylglycine-generating enzyme family protein [Stigmatella sp. ncwal1]|uniref:Bifunctional serine/threonine-protein kinase/formylglycine-generating enzyme family protein n=1 Tax=Stigmatella ashevillensis TaxID=2995309 RepID=A0ABT5DCM8_9BACT|nr:bifunctional serine/threonine-protein kinase/formylglycine-generating enzyme family protein [Stigmatella ashevillena]MDC0711427.1 bifunctional serine/threonine-protein kinase/formylglycine-generating enzyme family protein [Stigmatella ashevillena]
MLPLPSWNPPPFIDEYRLIQLIGRGGMGQIYLAEDTLLERLVAVKFVAMMRPDERARQRFQLEARAIARLSHPNVVSIHRVGEFDSRPYLVTEFVRGKSIEELPKPLPWKQALRIGSSLARGLAAAHRRGVLHRDIKPANVMLTEEEQVKLLDFGLAKLLAVPSGPTGEPLVSSGPGARSDLTGAGGMVGTPLYMAPETLQGAAATRSSDIYAVGAVLYELCSGTAPRQTAPQPASFEDWTELEPVPLEQVVPGVDPRLATVITRCLQRAPEDRFSSAEELCGALDALAVERFTGELPEGNPYRGLQAFDAKHRALFFGRDAESLEVIERLRSEPLVVVTGDSGVGKSSLCRASVLPSISEGTLEDGRTYRLISLVPGRYPAATLAATAAAALGKEEGPLTELLWNDPKGFSRELRGNPERTAGVLIFLDQAEELFTLATPQEAAALGEALGWAIRGSKEVRVLVTVRGDFLARFAGLPVLGDEVPRGLYLLRGLPAEAARAAIVEPARRKGVAFESEAIVEELVASSGTAAGGLPLLQFAMAELWETRDRARHQIPASALDALGGVGGALARHADGVLASLPPAWAPAARNILLRLVTAEGTRARRSRAELEAAEPQAAPVLETLVRSRLLVAREERGDTAYEVAHEALLLGWDTLRGWLDADAGKRKIRERVEAAASEWVRLEKAPETLWSERLLAEAQILDPSDTSPLGMGFLTASRTLLRRKRYRQWVFLAAAPLAVVLALGAIGLRDQWELQRRVDERYKVADIEAARGRQLKQEASRLREAAHARFSTLGPALAEEAERRVTEAEGIWTQAQEAAESADARLSLAARILEGTLNLGTGDARIQALLGDVLLDRIELADWFHHPERSRELSERLDAYDRDGLREKRLKRPPSLSITTSPPGALVELEQYEDEDGDGRKNRVPTGVLGHAPIFSGELAGGPGSYLLTLRAPDRMEVRYPLLIAPGESLSIHLWLPKKTSIPDGFVYVPPGAFLFGSTAPDVLRRGLLRASPVHLERTGAFLIQRTEVSFGEWIQFLNSLESEEERRRHLPRSNSPPMALELRPGEDGKWELVLGSGPKRVSAREGAPLWIPGRPKPQEWWRFPVMSISQQDAIAYTRWLGKTGQVPGARLCTELEWERAARGADGRAYPHGDLLLPTEATIDETYKRKAFGPDEVDANPASESPFGLLNTAGNVYEWVSSMRSKDEALIRGGAWYYDAWIAFASNRTVADSETKDPTVGFRVCATAPQAESL